MCGNRLKLWKTMPTSRRSASTSTPGPLTRSPSRRISPPWIASSPLMQRSSVDLPQPDGPIRQTTWCSLDVEVRRPCSTSMAPKRLWTSLDLEQRHQPPRVRRWSRSSRRSTQRACGMVMMTNRKATVVTEDRLKWLLATILAWLKASTAPMTLTSAVSFCSADEVVEQRRDDPAHRLRHHDEAQRLEVGEAERARGRDLAPVDALDAGAVDLGDVGAVGQGQRQDRVPFGRPVADQRQAGQRQAEADEVDADDRRQAAEDVGVDGGDQPDRLAGRAGDQPGDGDDQAPDQHEDLGDDEDVDVEPERLEDQPEGIPDQRQVEEGAGDGAVVGDHERGGDHHQEGGHRVADGDAGPGLAGGGLDSRRHQVGGDRRPGPACRQPSRGRPGSGAGRWRRRSRRERWSHRAEAMPPSAIARRTAATTQNAAAATPSAQARAVTEIVEGGLGIEARPLAQSGRRALAAHGWK